MAYNISDKELVKLLITDPAYPSFCLVYHRAQLRQLLPAMASAYLLVYELQQEILERLQSETK